MAKKCKNPSCGKEFTPKYSKTERHCSRECFNKDKKPNLKLKSPLVIKKKKCQECKEYFMPVGRYENKVCDNIDCKVSYALKIVEKTKIQNEKKFKQKLKSSTTNWKNELQKEVNKIVRLIDFGLDCLARQRGGQIHAGHIYARGGNSNIKYNLHNIHRQNAQSNHFQNDDGLLREGVIREYGQDYMNFITDLKATETPKLKSFEYEELTFKAKKIVLKLKKISKKHSLEKRIELRNQINIELGIYEEKYCIFNK